MIGLQRIEVEGKRFVLLEEGEYERLCREAPARMREMEVKVGELENELGNERHTRQGYQNQRNKALTSQKALSVMRCRAQELAVELRAALHRESLSEAPTMDADRPESFDLAQVTAISMLPQGPETSGVILGRLLEVLAAAAEHDWTDPDAWRY